MRTGERRTYAEIDYWRKVQRFLPARMRVSKGREPTEEWWSWCGAEIHLDRYATPAAPLTVVLLHGAGGNGRLLAPFGLLLHGHGYEAVLPFAVTGTGPCSDEASQEGCTDVNPRPT